MGALKERIEALERRLESPERAPGEFCKSCGAPAVRVVSEKKHPKFGHMGAKNVTKKCAECGFETTDFVKP